MVEYKKRYEDEIISKLERLTYEVESRKSLIAFLLKDSNINETFLNKYIQEYQEFFVELELTKQIFEREYIKKDFPKAIKWNIDFIEDTTYIEVEEDEDK
jgi:hypothetical protein